MYRWAEHDISGEEQGRKREWGEGDQQADTQADKGIVSRICTYARMYICTDGRNTTQPVKNKRKGGGLTDKHTNRQGCCFAHLYTYQPIHTITLPRHEVASRKSILLLSSWNFLSAILRCRQLPLSFDSSVFHNTVPVF